MIAQPPLALGKLGWLFFSWLSSIIYLIEREISRDSQDL